MAFTKVAPAGIGSTPGDGYRIGDSFLHSTGVEITNINATGIVTAASLDISGAIDFDGHTELDNVNISGVSTFAGNIDANGDLDVDGHTNLDNVSVAGVSTFSGIVAAGVGSTAITLSNSHKMTFGSEHELEMFHDGSNSYIKQRYIAYPSNLNIISENSSINIMSGSGGNAHGGYENAIQCLNNGAVKLYHAGVGPHLETNGGGITVQGNIQLGDKLIHNGDTDTCVRFPAANTISAETTGNERLRINSTGQIITNGGSANPYPTRAATFQPPSGQTNCFISIVSGSTSGASGITFGDGADNNAANYAGMFEYRHNTDTLAYMQNASDRLRIASDGDLTIVGSDNAELKLLCGSSSGNDIIAFQNSAGATRGNITYDSDHNFLFFNVNQGEKLRITSDGGLESYSASDANPNFKFRSDDVNWHGYLNQTVHGATISTILSCGGTWTVDGTTYNATKDYNGSFGTAALIVHNQYNSTATGGELVFVTKANGSSTTDGAVTERFRITSTGNVGISSVTPSSPLEIHTNASAAWKFRINTSVSDGAGFYQRSNGDFELVLRDASNNNNYIVGSGGELQFATSGSERLRIGSSGEIHLGTTNWPTGSIGKSAGRVVIGNEGSLTIWNETNSAGGGGTVKLACKEGSNSTRVGFVNVVGGTENTSDRSGFFKVEVSNSSGSGIERFRITSDGTVNCLGTTALKVPTGTTAQRPTGTTGMLRYNTTTEELEAYGSNNFWFNVKDGKFQGEGDIGTASNPAYSGKQLKDLGRSSGNYYIKPQGYSGSAIETYVDMTTNGGGWVLVAAFPLVHTNLTMSGNTGGLNESSVKNYATTVPSNNSAAFYNKNFINYLFHQNANGDPYSTYSIAGVHGQSGNGYILWEVRANSSNRLSTIDAFKTIYKTNEANNKFDVRYYRNSSNTLNNYVGRVPSDFNSYANYTYGRAGTSDNANNYHYLIDDITTGYQWGFRENSDDNPGNYNGYDLSNVFIR